MDNLAYESKSTMTRTRGEQTTGKRINKGMKRWVRILMISGIVIIWGLIAYGGFVLARNYVQDIQHQLTTITQTNQIELEKLSEQLTTLKAVLDDQQTNALALNQQFTAVEDELTAVKEEMSLAGDSLSTAAETKQALSERISDLSAELAELRKLIKRLEEAARVY